MSTPTERFDFAVKVLRETKEATVSSTPQDDPGDMRPVVFFERDGEIMAAGNAPQVDRDLGLELARIGIRGFAADSVIWCADAHVANQLINPNTGKRWGPGEMQNACDNEGACLVGVLQDCLLVTRVDRALGVLSYLNLPYEVDKEARTVDWATGPEWSRSSWDSKSGGVVDGYIADTLMAAFRVPILRHDLIAKAALPLGLPGAHQAAIDQITVAGLSIVGMHAALIDTCTDQMVAEYASAQ